MSNSAVLPVTIELRDATPRTGGSGGASAMDPSLRDSNPSESAAAVEEVRQAAVEAGGRIEADAHRIDGKTLHPTGGITWDDVDCLAAHFDTGKAGWYVLKGCGPTYLGWLRNRKTRSVRVTHGPWSMDVRGPEDFERAVAELSMRLDPPVAAAPPPEPEAAPMPAPVKKPAAPKAKVPPAKAVKAAKPKTAKKAAPKKPAKAKPKAMEAAKAVKAKPKPAKKAAPKKAVKAKPKAAKAKRR